MLRCPCWSLRPGGRPGPRRSARWRPPPCTAAAGLYLVLLFSRSILENEYAPTSNSSG